MGSHLALLVMSFGVILAGSELFTNSVEWAGEKLGVSDAAVGSLLAAVGTALPETFIPAVAILMGRGYRGPHEQIGVGAIVGAPLMLSTVAMFIMGLGLVVFRKRRGYSELRVAPEHVRRDLRFFLPIFLPLVLVGALFDPGRILRRSLAVLLLVVYGFYSWLMLQVQRPPEAAVEHGLYLETVFGHPPSRPRSWTTGVQLALGVGAIVLGARQFVQEMVSFSAHAGVNAGVLSLILSPFATELPEKYNSIIWIRQKKDNLALANITGAMVFQSCIPVALGIAFTPWHLSHAEVLAGVVALLSSALLYVNCDHKLETPTLMLGGIAYVVFLAGVGLLGAF